MVARLFVCLAAGLLRLGAAELVDHHQHLFSPQAAARATAGWKGITADELIGVMDAAGIRRAVVLSVAYGFANPNKPRVEDEYAAVRAENDWTSAQVKPYRDRLIGFCSVNPLREYAIAEIDRCAKDPNLRRGLKLHFGNSDVNVTDPEHLARVRGVFAAANRHRMAIVGHIRTTVDKGRAYGAAHARAFLEQILPAAPNVTVQIAHLAGSGGYDDPAVDEAVAVFAAAAARKDRRMNNVYFDVSGVAGIGKWEERSELIVRRMRELGMERMLFGSDAAVKGNLPADALERLRKLPLTPGELRTFESNVAPYVR